MDRARTRARATKLGDLQARGHALERARLIGEVKVIMCISSCPSLYFVLKLADLFRVYTLRAIQNQSQDDNYN